MKINSRAGRIGIAIGDPNGIGAEIAIRAAIALHRQRGMRSMVVGESFIVERCADTMGVSDEARDALDVCSVGALDQKDWKPGEVSRHAGAATVAYVDAALAQLRDGSIAAIAAAPHCEAAVNAAGVAFNGYSGLLADRTGTPRDQVFLMLAAHELRVVHCTLHEPVQAAVARITPALVESAADAARKALHQLGIAQPRICVLGINPHAGEEGLFGDDDERITKPAVNSMRSKGWAVDGPVGADLALSERKYEAFVAMLHDQGHIAVKMLSPKGAIALLAGLPLLFASVGHGAGFDLAGKGVADASAMTSVALLLADAVA